jgi:LIVCS family branched-chain amino acid:cation transporter
MDMMGSAVFSMAIVFEITNRGYKDAKSQFGVIISSGTICGLLLFIVYGGLAWLGATAKDVYPGDLTQTELLTKLTLDILGKPGLLILALIVACACMTTAVGLLTSVSSFFSELTNGKVSYGLFVTVFTLFSWVVSNFGISVIISIAAPILQVMFPVLIVLTVLRLFRKHIKSNFVYTSTSGIAALVALTDTISSLTGVPLGTEHLPLSDMGFGWVVPALIASLISLLISYDNTKNSGR